MKLSSEQWKNGIADSHYTGVANLRNVRIDDVGVLRVMNRPTLVSGIPAPILDIKKGYYDISNDYYAIFGDNSSGNGGIYESKSNSIIEGSDSYSGGMVWRNYFFPLPSEPNTDEGYWEDTDNDGGFDTKNSSFETLVTKGQTQNIFSPQFSKEFGGRSIAMINDDKYIVDSIALGLVIRDKDGSTDATINTSTYTSSVQDVFKVSDTACGVVTQDTIYVYDLSGTELATYSYDFTRGDDLQHLEAKNRGDNEFVILSQTRAFNTQTVDYATGSGIDFDNFPGNSNWDTVEFNDELQDYDNDYFSDNGDIYKLQAEYSRYSNFFENFVEGVYANVSSFPATGDVEKLYIDNSTNTVYSWNGSSYEVNNNYLAYDDDNDFPAIGDDSKFYLDIGSERGYYWVFVYNLIVSNTNATDAGDDFDNPEDYLEFLVYDFNGTDTITQDSRDTVWNGDAGDVLLEISHIACLNEDIAVMYEDGTIAGAGGIYVFEKSGSSWSQKNTIIPKVSGTGYAPMEGIGDTLIIFGNTTVSYNWDDSSNELEEADSTILAPNGVQDVGGSGDYFGIISAGGQYSVYKYNTSKVDYTPSITIRDTMYWANGNSIASLQERGAQDTFDPTDSDTYTLLIDALDLPVSTKITALADIGTYMAIGTESGKIFFWDLQSDSFEIPVNIGEPIGAMNSKNNLLYITSQKAGNVYIANLSSYQKSKNLSSLTKFRFNTTVKGMEFFDDGAYMGAEIENDPTYTGIWIFKNGAWTLIGTDEQVTAIAKSSPNVLVYSTTNGIYELDIAGSPKAVWSDDKAYIVTPMELVGSVSNKGNGTAYSMYFDEQFGSNEYVKLYYRTTTSGEWKHVQTMTSEQLVADSGLFAFKGQLSVQRTEQIQYKIVLNTTAGMVLFDTN